MARPDPRRGQQALLRRLAGAVLERSPPPGRDQQGKSASSRSALARRGGRARVADSRSPTFRSLPGRRTGRSGGALRMEWKTGDGEIPAGRKRSETGPRQQEIRPRPGSLTARPNVGKYYKPDHGGQSAKFLAARPPFSDPSDRPGPDRLPAARGDGSAGLAAP